MPPNKRLSAYVIERQIFEAALARSAPLRYTMESKKAAAHFRQRAYMFRSLIAWEHPEFDTLVLRLENNVVIIERSSPKGILTDEDGNRISLIKPPTFTDTPSFDPTEYTTEFNAEDLDIEGR